MALPLRTTARAEGCPTPQHPPAHGAAGLPPLLRDPLRSPALPQYSRNHRSTLSRAPHCCMGLPSCAFQPEEQRLREQIQPPGSAAGKCRLDPSGAFALAQRRRVGNSSTTSQASVGLPALLALPAASGGGLSLGGRPTLCSSQLILPVADPLAPCRGHCPI